MKKILLKQIAIMLVIIILFGTSACANTPQQPQQPEQKDPQQQEEQKKEPTEEQYEEKIPEPEYIYEHVVIIGVDGAGAFFKETDTPNVDRIFENSATTYKAITATPSISGPAWGSLLCGVKPEFHLMRNSTISEKEHSMDSEYPSIFRIVREKYPDAELASFCNYYHINIGIIENEIGVHKEKGSDEAITANILTYLDTVVPKLLFVQFDSVDGAGHTYNYGSEKYLAQITEVDKLIGQIYDKYETLGVTDSTLFIVTADHGGTPYGLHGGSTPAEMEIFLGVKGKTVVNGTIGDCEIRDIAAITAFALGADIPDNWSGKIPDNLFEGVKSIKRKEFDPPIPENRKHETEETPDPFGGNYLTDVLGKNNCKLILPFDGDISDVTYNYDTEISGKLYFSPGYHGQCATFDDGFITVRGFKFDKDSFSVATWVNSMVIDTGAILCGTKGNQRCDSGMEIGFGDGYVSFILADGNNFRFEPQISTPNDNINGWMHLILTVDRQNNKVTVYCDFEKIGEADIPSEVENKSANGMKFNIGQSAMNSDNPLTASLDDFIIYDGVITEEQITKLKTYYGK